MFFELLYTRVSRLIGSMFTFVLSENRISKKGISTPTHTNGCVSDHCGVYIYRVTGANVLNAVDIRKKKKKKKQVANKQTTSFVFVTSWHLNTNSKNIAILYRNRRNQQPHKMHTGTTSPKDRICRTQISTGN